MKKITVALYEEEGVFVAHCLNLDVASFGETQEEALDTLKEAVMFHLEEEGDEYVEIANPQLIEMELPI